MKQRLQPEKITSLYLQLQYRGCVSPAVRRADPAEISHRSRSVIKQYCPERPDDNSFGVQSEEFRGLPKT